LIESYDLKVLKIFPGKNIASRLAITVDVLSSTPLKTYKKYKKPL
jgi:hypothetical protein